MAPSSTIFDSPDRVAKEVQKSKFVSLASAIKSETKSSIDIIDIRHNAVEINLKEEILACLRPRNGPRTMPTLLLYDDRGLQLFEEVSNHDIIEMKIF